MTAEQERAAVVALSGGVIVGIDRADGTDTYCEMRWSDDGVIQVLDLYAIERGEHLEQKP